jgi:arylsulfatase A-like enzyme
VRRSTPKLRLARGLGIFLCCAALLTGIPFSSGQPKAQAAGKPNLLFILTDDQRADSMGVMPKTVANFKVNFPTAIIVEPLCCPSRASILTGEYPHNTGVMDNQRPGYIAFDARDEQSLGPWLQGQGYFTGFVGKYFNSFSPSDPTPPGWNEFYGYNGLGSSGSDLNAYVNYSLREHFFDGSILRDRQTQYTDTYSTTLFGDLAERFIRRAQNPVFNPGNKPWALLVWVKAPHSPYTPDTPYLNAPVPSWTDPPSFMEPDLSDKPVEVTGAPLAATDPLQEHRIRQGQLRTLMSVDDMVGRLWAVIDEFTLRGRTWGVFSSDNGLFLGEHKLAGKNYAYEEGIRVPLRMAIPNQPARNVPGLYANIDIAPTLMDLAGDPSSHAFDGRSILDVLQGRVPQRQYELLEGYPDAFPAWFRYDGLRTKRYTYIKWASGNLELYDLSTDPYQLNNIASQQPALVQQLQQKVDQLKAS